MEKLILVQSELKCPKGNYNSFGKYKYRSAEDILEALKPILFKHKCTLTLKDDVTELGSTHVLKATAIFSDGSNSVEVTGFAGIDYNMKGMSVPQMYGSSSSYARKYALNGLFLIDETEQDADHDNKQQPKQKTKPEIKEEWFTKAIERITAGEKTLIDKLKSDYSLTVEQLNKLESCK